MTSPLRRLLLWCRRSLWSQMWGRKYVDYYKWGLLNYSCELNLFPLRSLKACRISNFEDIDFQNFFIWGDENVKTLTNPDCESPCRSSDVKNEFKEIVCPNIKDWRFLLWNSNFFQGYFAIFFGFNHRIIEHWVRE